MLAGLASPADGVESEVVLDVDVFSLWAPEAGCDEETVMQTQALLVGKSEVDRLFEAACAAADRDAAHLMARVIRRLRQEVGELREALDRAARWTLALRRVAGALEESCVMAARPEDIANGVRQLQMRAHIAETALSAVAKAVDRTGQRIQNADGFWVPPTAEQLPEAVDNLHQNLRAAQERADELRGANGWLQQQLLEARDALSRESR